MNKSYTWHLYYSKGINGGVYLIPMMKPLLKHLKKRI